eukprot:COSAG04_NODE_216_length_19953_cov_85.343558_14_plen_446_part_00
MRAAAALLVGFAAFQVVLIGLVVNTYTASPGSASPRRELQEPSAGEEVAPAAERDELRERLALLEATVQQQREGIMTEVKQGVLAAVRNEIDQLKEDFAVENSQLASRLDEVVARLDLGGGRGGAGAGEAAQGARHRKQARPGVCDANTFEPRASYVMQACCPSSAGTSSGGHRLMQAGCDHLPDTCPSLGCAEEAVGFAEDCAALLSQTPYFVDGIPMAEFSGMLTSCLALKSSAEQMLPTDVKMFIVLVDTGEGQSQSGAMFPSGAADGSGAPLDPLAPPPSLPFLSTLPPGSAPAAEVVHEYHVRCHSSTIGKCVPACNPEHHGYELLATIDGTDSTFSCKLAYGLYSWMGLSSDGGYLGQEFASFLSAVISGAAGFYIVTLSAGAGTLTDVMVQPGQSVHVSGDPSLVDPPDWYANFQLESTSSIIPLTQVRCVCVCAYVL